MRQLRYIYGLLLLASLWGCTREKAEFAAGIPVDLEVRVGATRALTEAGSADECRIERIRVMVFFRDNGALDAQIYDEHPGGFTSVPITKDMTVMSGDKVFCVIANEPTELKNTLDDITALNDLLALTVADETKYNTAGESLLMTVVRETRILVHHTDPVLLPIARAVGKVRMKLEKDPSNPWTVTLKSVQVVNTPASSRLMEGNPVVPTLTALTAETTFTPDEVTDHTPLEMTPLYLYEHYWGIGTAEKASEDGEATSLEIVVEVEKDPGSPVTETYRIPLIGAFENGDPVYSVVRNTIADLTVMYNEKLKIIYTVLPWEEDEYEKIPGQDEPNNFSVVDWIGPVEYPNILE